MLGFNPPAAAADSSPPESLEDLGTAEEYLVRLFRVLSSRDAHVSSMAAEGGQCPENALTALERAAKTPATVNEARRLLEHPTPLVRALAAAVLTTAGERGSEVQREMKWAIQQCPQQFAHLLPAREPEDLSNAVVLGTMITIQPDEQVVHPTMLYRRGGWEPVFEGPVVAPSRWRPALGKPQPFQTKTKAVHAGWNCDATGWVLPVVGPAPEPRQGLVLAGKLESRPIPEAPAELQSAIQGALKAHAPDEHRLLARYLLASTVDTEKDPTTIWTAAGQPHDTRSWCLPTSRSEWLCRAQQRRELRDTQGSGVESQQSCLSLFWLRGNSSAMRILQSSRECAPPFDDNSGEEPLWALKLEGRDYWLIGETLGTALWEPRTAGVRHVGSFSSGYCD